MKKLFVFISFAFPTVLFAQSDLDALRYSQSGLSGTARSLSMGGAFGALGADFSSLSVNPAGIGLYNKSEFTITPAMYSEKTSSDFLSNSSSDNKFNFNIGDIGLVFNKRLNSDDGSEGWKNINFGIGYNRLNDFNTRSTYEGTNPNNSYLDYILQGVNAGEGTPPNQLEQFYQNLAYQTYLINNPDSLNPNHYTSVIPNGGELQRRASETSGSSGEIVLSLGSNYSNRLYIGATLGIDFLNYTETTTYSEINQNGNIPGFNYFNLNQYLNTSGVGVNFKFGMIFRATDWIRIGAAVHTPTFYSMHDDYSTSMEALTDSGYHNFSSPAGSYDYNLNTPFKAIGSVAFIIGKLGLISADYEYLDYSTMRFSSDDAGAFFDVNNTIQQKYTATGNIKIGTEWRLGSAYRVRAGYAMFGSPFASGQVVSGADESMNSYSVGFGLRDKTYFIDIGYAYSISHDYVQQYYLADQTVPGSINKIVTNNFLLTFGYRF